MWHSLSTAFLLMNVLIENSGSFKKKINFLNWEKAYPAGSQVKQSHSQEMNSITTAIGNAKSENVKNVKWYCG